MAGRNAIIKVSVLSDTKGFHRGISEIEARFGKVGSKFDAVGQKAGKLLAGGITIAGAAAVKAGQAASDFAETTSKAAAVFGEDAMPALQKFADGAAKSIGQSKQTALDAATTFAVFGKSAGLSGDKLVDFSTDFTKLSSDMASFSNTTPEEAIEAIGAALRGEAEPIRKYGVLLDDATLRQEALALGLVKTTKEALTPQQKVLAAQAAIYKQTKDAQGDFARTSDGLANSQRTLKANFENLQVEIGQKVLPALLKLSEIGLAAVAWIGEHQRAVGIAAVALGGFAAVLYTVSLAMRAWGTILAVAKAAVIVYRNAQLALNLVMMANPIGLVIAAIAALVAIFVIAYKKSETFRNIVDKSWQAIKSATVAVWNFLKNLTSKIWDGIKAVITTQVNAAKAVVSKAWDAIKSVTTSVWNAIKSFFSTIWNTIKSLVQSQANLVKDAVKGAWDKAKDATSTVWNAIKDVVKNKIEEFMGHVRGIKGKITGAFSGAGSWLYQTGKDIIQGMINGVRAMADVIAGAAKAVVQGAIDAGKSLLRLGSPSKLFRQFGKWTGEGLVLGLKDMRGKAAQASSELSRKVADGFEAPKMTLNARPTLVGGGTGLGTTYQINVTAPVGASGADIGRTLIKYIDEYERTGGRRRA